MLSYPMLLSNCFNSAGVTVAYASIRTSNMDVIKVNVFVTWIKFQAFIMLLSRAHAHIFHFQLNSVAYKSVVYKKFLIHHGGRVFASKKFRE